MIWIAHIQFIIYLDYKYPSQTRQSRETAAGFRANIAIIYKTKNANYGDCLMKKTAGF